MRKKSAILFKSRRPSSDWQVLCGTMWEVLQSCLIWKRIWLTARLSKLWLTRTLNLRAVLGHRQSRVFKSLVDSFQVSNVPGPSFAFRSSILCSLLVCNCPPAGLLPLRSTWTTSRSPVWVAVSCICQHSRAVRVAYCRNPGLTALVLAWHISWWHGSAISQPPDCIAILKRSKNIWSTHSVELQCASMWCASCLAWRRLPGRGPAQLEHPRVSLLKGGMTSLTGRRLGPESHRHSCFPVLPWLSAQEVAGPALLLPRGPVLASHHRQEVCRVRLLLVPFAFLAYGTTTHSRTFSPPPLDC